MTLTATAMNAIAKTKTNKQTPKRRTPPCKAHRGVFLCVFFCGAHHSWAAGNACAAGLPQGLMHLSALAGGRLPQRGACPNAQNSGRGARALPGYLCMAGGALASWQPRPAYPGFRGLFGAYPFSAKQRQKSLCLALRPCAGDFFRKEACCPPRPALKLQAFLQKGKGLLHLLAYLVKIHGGDVVAFQLGVVGIGFGV